MSDLEQTPQTPSQFEMEDCDQTPASQELGNSMLTDEASVEGKVISLASKAAKDEALWDDYISSEDENYSPGKDEDEDDDEDDSDSEAAEDTSHHDACVAFCDELRAFLKEKGWKVQGSKKDARVALVGVLEDHFIQK